MKRALALLALAMLAGCGDKAPADKDAIPAEVKAANVAQAARPVDAGDGKVTSNADRIATLGLLNKRNNLTKDLVMKVGEVQREGNVIVRLESCERTAPWERPEETGAFVQIFVEERPAPRAKLEWRRIFSGWLFKDSPALNVVEHPVYDVWVKDCAMKFPGDDAKPASDAPSVSRKKASGNESTDAPAEQSPAQPTPEATPPPAEPPAE